MPKFYSKVLVINILTIMAIALSGCEKYDLLKGSGKTATIERQLLDFNTIEINDLFEINLVGDTLNKVIIMGGENLLDKIKTAVSNNTLLVSDKNTCGWTRSYDDKIKIEIHYKTLNHIILNGEATLNANTLIYANDLTIDVHSGISIINLKLKCNALHLNVHGGTGNYTLSGEVGVSYTYINGNGYLFAKDLQTEYTFINNSSTGDLHVNVSKELEYIIKNRGNIFYIGDPSKITNLNGSGKGRLINEKE